MNETVRAEFRSPRLSLGMWLSLGSPVVAEMAAQSGFDWLLIDMEHGSASEAAVLPMLQAVGSHPVASVVRVPSHESSLIGRVLDWGADAIMAPHVSDAREAEALAQAMRHPPEGRRGYSRTVRATAYGLRRPSEIPPVLLAQIESVEGAQNAEDIASVSGVDALFVGPADLQLSLATTPSAPNFEEALTRVTDAARTAGIPAGILVRDMQDIGKFLQRGFTKIAASSDMSLLREGFLRAAAGRPTA